MTRRYSTQALRAYAAEQIARADVMLSRHAEIAMHLCRCGDLHPCRERQQWISVRGKYRDLVRAVDDLGVTPSR